MTAAPWRGGGMRTARRRVRLLVSLALGPADAWLALRMTGWRLVLPYLKRRWPLPRLARLMWGRGASRRPRPERAPRIAQLADIVYRTQHVVRQGNCLERSLVLYRYLAAVGAEPQLLVGLRRNDGDHVGHAWVTVAGRPVHERQESVDQFVRVVVFGPGGAPCRAGEPAPGQTVPEKETV